MTEDMETEDMEMECIPCGRVTVHRIVHVQGNPGRGGAELTLRCSECGNTAKHRMKEERLVPVNYVLSEQGSSRRGTVSLFAEEFVEKGEELYLGENRSVVTAIETAAGRRNRAKASEISTLWAKDIERVVVRISVNRGSSTLSLRVSTEPEEEFSVGDIIDTEAGKAVVISMKTARGNAERGSVQARDIVRVYARLVRESFSAQPHRRGRR